MVQPTILMLVTIVYFVTLLPFATFFGIAVHLFIAPFYDKLSASAFIEYFQKVDPYMKVWAKFLLLAEIILTILLLVLQSDSLLQPQGLLTAFAFLCGVVPLVTAVRGNVPLNREMEQWDPAFPPSHWMQVRDRWLGYHKVRGIFEIGGFIALLVAVLIHVSRI